MLTGSEWGDNMQANLFPIQDNIIRFSFSEPYEHPLPEQLKDHGRLLDVFEHIINNDLESLEEMTKAPYN
jgi:hypothetical protein